MSLQQLRQELSAWLTSLGAGQVSKEFFELIKNIGEARSKQEERQIIQKEAQALKAQFASPDSTGKRMKELLVRALYCEMLGQEVPFAYIHALTMTQQPRLLDKRVGYLVAALCLTRHDEFRMLITNSFRRDLESTNHLEVCCALTAMVDLLTVETIPALFEPLTALISRPTSKAIVRKKVVHVLHRCLELWEKEREKEPEDSDLYAQECQTVMQHLQKLLCDSDPSVMMSVVGVLWPRIVKDAERESDAATSLSVLRGSSARSLLGAFLSIQKQVLDRHLRDYDYHQVAAPWLQIALLKILRVLGSRDVQAARDMYHILHDTLTRCVNDLRAVTTTTTAGAPPAAPILDVAAHNTLYAILYETIRTITRIYATQRQLTEGNKAIAALVEEAANHVSQMLVHSVGPGAGKNPARSRASRNPNVQYIALQCLTEIVALSPRYAAPHQLVLMQCLYDPDESIQRTTLELLYKMTTVANVAAVVEQLLFHLQRSTDAYLRTELIQRITSLAEKFAPSPEWYTKVMMRTLRLGGDLLTLRHAVVPQLIHTLRTGTGDADMTRALRTHALHQALEHLAALSSGEALPDILILTIAWIIGEYGHLHASLPPNTLLELLGDLLERQYILDDVRVWIAIAIQKRLAYVRSERIAVDSNLRVWSRLRRYATSRHLLTQQLCDEVLAMAESLSTNTFPFATSEMEMITIDTSLPFLEVYTQHALSHNARPYQPVDITGDVATQLAGYSTAPRLNSKSTRSGKRSSSGLKYGSYGVPSAAQLPVRSNTQLVTTSASLFEMTPSSGSATESLSSPAVQSLTSLKGVTGPWSAQGYGVAKRDALDASPSTSLPSNEPKRETVAAPSSSPFHPLDEKTLSAEAIGRAVGGRQSTAVVTRPRTKEERLAARLFQSGSGDSDVSFASSVSGTPVKSVAVAKRPATHTSEVASLLSSAGTVVSSGGPRSDTQHSTLSPSLSSSSLTAATVSSPASHSPVKEANTSSDALLLNIDLLSPLSSSLPPTSTVVSSAASSSPLKDSPKMTSSLPSGLFDSISLPAPLLATQRQSVGEWRDNFDYDNLTPTPLILREIDGKPRSHHTGQILVNDTDLRIAYFNVWNDDAVCVVLFVTNKSEATLDNIALDLTPPANCQVSYQADTVVDLSQTSAHKVHITAIPSRATVLVLLTLTVTQYTIHSMILSGIVSYKSVSGHSDIMRIAKFLVPLELCDVLRAKEITLDTYGQQWAAHTAEEKLSVRHAETASFKTVDAFVTSLKNWHFYPVKVIGKEIVSCARFLRTVAQKSTSEESLVLLHSKVDTATQTFDFKVRTKDKVLTELVIRFLNQTLQQK